jgi:GGDEF domain-containing protein
MFVRAVSRGDPADGFPDTPARSWWWRCCRPTSTAPYLFAERDRTALGALRVPREDGDGGHLRVTASLCAAAIPVAGEDKNALIAAADVALYRAKRAGRKPTARAEKQASEPLAAE